MVNMHYVRQFKHLFKNTILLQLSCKHMIVLLKGFDPDQSEEAKKRRQRHRNRGAPGGGFQGNEANTGPYKNGPCGTAGRARESQRQPEKRAARDWRHGSEVKGRHGEGARYGKVMGAEGGVGRPQEGGGRGGRKGAVNERSVQERSGGGRRREQSGADRDRAKSCSGEKAVSKGWRSTSGTRRGDWDRGGERRGGSMHPAGGDKAPKCHRLGYKTLEELCEKEPSAVAFTLASHPAIKDLLNDRDMRKDLVQLVCQVLSKALRSRTERATKQHLATIIKDSEFFCSTLLYSLVGMESESDPVRRLKHPQLLGNILTILSEVCTELNAVEITI